MASTSGGLVVWFTGLPCSGKTTIATRLVKALRSRAARVEVLDGDEVRKWLSPEAGFGKADRERHLHRVAHVSRLLARNGITVLASFVSPYRKVREEARRIIENDEVRFFEVYVKCGLETCMKRDKKGLYKAALEGRIKDMTGVSDVYGQPLNPDLTVDTENDPLDECLGRVLEMLATAQKLDRSV